MRWKWQILKLSSIWLFTIGATVISIVFIGLAGDWEILGRNDLLILSAFASWILLLSFVQYFYVHSSRQLLQKSNEMPSYRTQPMLLALWLNLLVLAGWIFAGIVIVQAFSEAEPGTHPATIVLVFACLLLLSIAIAVANYLLAINAYFELQHMLRKQQEDILHAIGNPYMHDHP
jgi:Na+/proline symporter